jgi:hypothetical protein
MIDATRECQSRPGDAEPQLALKNAAEQLVQVGNFDFNVQGRKFTFKIILALFKMKICVLARGAPKGASGQLSGPNSAKAICQKKSSLFLFC